MMTIGLGLLVSRPRQQEHVVDHIYKNMWHTMSTRTHGRLRHNTTSSWTCGRPRQQTTSTMTHGRPRQKICVSISCQKRHVPDHVNKYTWHNQMMTSINWKLARAMSTSDIRKLRHSERISLGVSPSRNVKSPEVSKDKVPKLLLAIDLRYPSNTILIVRSRR
jgi:hypothetical protein